MPLHVMANFGGFLCECMAWKGHIVRGDRCLKDYGFRLSQARVDSAELVRNGFANFILLFCSVSIRTAPTSPSLEVTLS
eukprot:Em0001g1694a